jgi:hypothetical protein
MAEVVMLLTGFKRSHHGSVSKTRRQEGRFHPQTPTEEEKRLKGAAHDTVKMPLRKAHEKAEYPNKEAVGVFFAPTQN